MKQSFQNRLAFFILCLCAGLLSLFFLPLSNHWFSTEKKLFSQEATLTEYGVTLFNVEEKSHTTDYLLCIETADPDYLYNETDYQPVDLALTINNLKRLQIRHLFLATQLHWPDLDPEENNTLASSISELDSCVLSTKLKLSPSASEIPVYLVKSSIPIDQVDGNKQLIPEVNNTSLAPTFNIPHNTLVGFSKLESEEPSHKTPLLARWGDRVILSFLLLERLHQLECAPSDIKITLGQHIYIAKHSIYIPIDKFGYFSPTHKKEDIDVKPHIIASHIGETKESPTSANSAIIYPSKEATRLHTAQEPVIKLAQLSHTKAVSNERTLQRIPFWAEVTLLFIIALLLAKYSVLSRPKFSLLALVIFADIIVISLLLNRYTIHWFPVSHSLILIATSWLTFLIFTKSTLNQTTDSNKERAISIDQKQTDSGLSETNAKSRSKKRLSSKKAKLKQSFKRSKNSNKFNKKKG